MGKCSSCKKSISSSSFRIHQCSSIDVTFSQEEEIKELDNNFVVKRSKQTAIHAFFKAVQGEDFLVKQEIIPENIHLSPSFLNNKNGSKVIPGQKATGPFLIDAFTFGMGVPGCQGFFLTHFHSDHYAGLSVRWKSQVPVYASPVTAAFVQHVYGLAVIALAVTENNDEMIWHPVGSNCSSEWSVSLLDANHCPGSVMLVFKQETAKDKDALFYLHTGDFRANQALIRDLPKGIEWDAIYMDCTYSDAAYCHPDQDQVIQEACKRVVELLKGYKKPLVQVQTYLVGKERLTMALAESLHTLIYAGPKHRLLAAGLEKWHQGRFVNLLTEDPLQAAIHLTSLTNSFSGYSNNANGNSPINNNTECDICVILKPTGWVQAFQEKHSQKNNADAIQVDVPYSEHSSHAELVNFLKAARPWKWIVPTVGPAQGYRLQSASPKKLLERLTRPKG